MSYKRKLAEQVLFASRAHKASKAARLGIIVTAIMSFLIFAISYYGEVVGNFTFSLDRTAQDTGITMYDDSVNKNYSVSLTADRVEKADGMTGYCGTEFTDRQVGNPQCIPPDDVLTSVDGGNNGVNYIDYTFYIENVGDTTVDINAEMNLLSEAKGAVESLRVRIIIDGIGTTYAKRQSSRGDSPGELEPLTEAFYSTSKIMQQQISTFKPGDITKVTVVVWYEGEDADHTNNIMGGGIKLDMKFTVANIYENN